MALRQRQLSNQSNGWPKHLRLLDEHVDYNQRNRKQCWSLLSVREQRGGHRNKFERVPLDCPVAAGHHRTTDRSNGSARTNRGAICDGGGKSAVVLSLAEKWNQFD